MSIASVVYNVEHSLTKKGVVDNWFNTSTIWFDVPCNNCHYASINAKKWVSHENQEDIYSL